jgi:hypothetical protein
VRHTPPPLLSPLTAPAFLSLLHPESVTASRLHLAFGGYDSRPICAADAPLAASWLDGTQPAFYTPNRFAPHSSRRLGVNVSHLAACYADIDRHERGSVSDPCAILTDSLARLDVAGFPRPSLCTFTGRGVHLLWLLAGEVSAARAQREWARVQTRLAEVLDADRQVATDTARLLRLPGSYNVRAGRVAESYTVTGARYRLADLLTAAAPANDSNAAIPAVSDSLPALHPEPLTDAADGPTRRYQRHYRKVLRACADLRELREWETLPPGKRHALLFVEGTAYRHLYGREGVCVLDAHATALIPGYTASDIRAHVCDGFTRPNPYRLRSGRVLDVLEATAEEREQIEAREAERRRERDRLRKARQRRAAGIPTREDNAALTASRCATAHTLRAQGMTRQGIADLLGVSLASVRNYLRATPQQVGGNSLPPHGLSLDLMTAPAPQPAFVLVGLTPCGLSPDRSEGGRGVSNGSLPGTRLRTPPGGPYRLHPAHPHRLSRLSARPSAPSVPRAYLAHGPPPPRHGVSTVLVRCLPNDFGDKRREAVRRERVSLHGEADSGRVFASRRSRGSPFGESAPPWRV